MTHTLKQLGVKAVVALGLGLGAWTSGVAQQYAAAQAKGGE